MEKIVLVNGMMCGHCEKAVKTALEGLAFVAEAAPDRNHNKVAVSLSGDMDEAAVKKTIEDAGYTFGGIE